MHFIHKGNCGFDKLSIQESIYLSVRVHIMKYAFKMIYDHLHIRLTKRKLNEKYFPIMFLKGNLSLGLTTNYRISFTLCKELNRFFNVFKFDPQKK